MQTESKAKFGEEGRMSGLLFGVSGDVKISETADALTAHKHTWTTNLFRTLVAEWQGGLTVMGASFSRQFEQKCPTCQKVVRFAVTMTLDPEVAKAEEAKNRELSQGRRKFDQQLSSWRTGLDEELRDLHVHFIDPAFADDVLKVLLALDKVKARRAKEALR